MRTVVLMSASLIGLGLVVRPDSVGAQAMALTNIEIRMVKTSTKPPLRITAETRNPNDFAVREIEVDCTIKDKAGKDLATYSSVIFGPLPPNLRVTTRNLNIGAWPPEGYAGLCISKRAQRMAQPGPAPAPLQPAPAPAPGGATQSTAPEAAPPPAK